MTACRSCGAAIVWAVTTNNRRMPVDANPVPDGNLTLAYPSPGAAPIAVHADPGALLIDNPPRYVSHFATCEFADQHRKSR
jgi:hypothetical protein